ncbi:uncharacterized protein [Antedon mediterranea]|uniref:uncharacterized protein n=1 Tax=Antedon mediterranea TaxID=105859 RepID=UPI003AF47EC9
MDDDNDKKTFLIDINIKYQFTGTEGDIVERLKNDKESMKNSCNSLLNTGSINNDTSFDISVTAVHISNAVTKQMCTVKADQPISEALEVLATATELRQTMGSEPAPQENMARTITEDRPESDIVKQSMNAILPSCVSIIKPQTEHHIKSKNKKVTNTTRCRPRPIAIKPQPPTIYGHTASTSQQFVPLILKPVNNPFTIIPQTQVVQTDDTMAIKKPMSCSQPISPQASEFVNNQKSFASDLHTFRPVKPNELLLDIYESHLHMFAESVYSRSSLWDKVATKMVEHGYKVTGCQCNNRWRYLLATFNKVAASGEGTHSFKYFNRVAEILHKKSTMPGVKSQGVLDEAMLEVLGHAEQPVVKKRRRRKEDEKDELIATLSKKMEQLQEMQNEMTTFLSEFKSGAIKKQ